MVYELLYLAYVRQFSRCVGVGVCVWVGVGGCI